MQTGIAVHDTDHKQGNAMNHNPQRCDSSQEKQMNATTKATSVAVLVALGLALAARAAEPAKPETPPDLDKLVAQPADLAPWAYAWRADREVQEQPEAYFIPRRLAHLEKTYRKADTEPTIQIAPDKWSTFDQAKFVKSRSQSEGPMIPAPTGALQAALLWEWPVLWRQIVLQWPKDKGNIPSPEAVEVRFYPPTADGFWFAVCWDRLAGKPEVSADGLTWTYSFKTAAVPDGLKAMGSTFRSYGALKTDMVAVFVDPARAAAGAKHAVPSIEVYGVPPKWKRLDLEIEWGFQPGTEKLDYDGRIEGHFALPGRFAPLAGDAGTAMSDGGAWKSRASGAARRGVTGSVLCLDTDFDFWSVPPAPELRNTKDRRNRLVHPQSLITVWTASGNFTFLAGDLEKGPILAPEYGFFVRKSGSGPSAREFAAELKAKGEKSILERTREHREATAEEAMREIKLALLPAGTTLPAFKQVEDPPMQVQVPEAWWNDAWRKGVYQLKKGPYSYAFVCPTEGANHFTAAGRVGLHGEVANRWLGKLLALPGQKVEGDFVDGDGNFHFHTSGQRWDWVSCGGATGKHLLTMAEHYLLTGDREWFIKNRERIQKGADWLIRQRNAYMKDIPNRKDLWCAGLQPPASSGESWGRSEWRWWYFVDVVSCEALDAFARALAYFDPDQAKRYRAEVERYRADIRRAIERSIALTPVRRLRNGTYRSYAPGACYFRSDLNGRAYGCGDLLHMQTIAAFDWRADDPRLAGALETQEDAFLFLRNTWTLAGARQKKGLSEQEDWFWGGIANALGWFFLTDAHLVRDDVPAFLRSWVNNYAAFVCPTPNGEYYFAEGFPETRMTSTGGYPNSNSTGGFIRNFRNLLVMEEYCGEQGHIEQGRLWLARATPRAWLEQGKKISVKNAPTYFGTVAYEIVSDADHGRISATVEMPSRKAPKEVVLRFRHPKSAPIKAVTVNGKEWKDFNKDKETIELKGLTGTVAVTAQY